MKQKALYLLVIPILYLSISLYFCAVRGPNWIMLPSDFGYMNVLNGVNLLLGKPPGNSSLPAATVNIIASGVVWITHSILGADPIEIDVLKQPELYQSLLNLVVTTILFVAMVIAGFLAYLGTRELSFALLVQASAFLVPIFDHAFFLTHGYPEDLQLGAAMLLVAVTLFLLGPWLRSEASDGTMPAPSPGMASGRAWLRLAVIGGLLCGFGVASKYTFIPLVAFPLLLLPGVKWKWLYVIALSATIAALMFPIFMIYQETYHSLLGVAGTAAVEHTVRSAELDPFTRIWVGLRLLFWDSPIFFAMLIGSACICGVAVCLRGIAATLQRPLVLRLFVSTILSVSLGILFLAVRPQSRYLVTVSPFSSLALCLSLMMASGNGKAHRWERIVRQHSGVIASCVIFVIFSWAAMQLQFADRLAKELANDTLTINTTLARNYKGYAKIHGVQSSNTWWALVLNDLWARRSFAERLREIVPQDVYFYDWDGVSYFDAGGNKFSIQEIAARHDGVVFAITSDKSGKGPAGPLPTYIPPCNVVFRPSVKMSHEGIFEVSEISLSGIVSVGPSPEAESTQCLVQGCSTKWISNGPFPQWLQLTFPMAKQEIIRYELCAIDTGGQCLMPSQWEFLGSNDGIQWDLLDERNIDRGRDEKYERSFDINQPGKYQYYRILVHSAPANRLQVNGVRLFCRPGTLHGQPAFVRKAPLLNTACNRSAESVVGNENYARSGFWEVNLPGPLELTVDMEAGNRMSPMAYVIGSGSHGPEARQRMPRSWYLEGSDDRQHWQTLDRRTEQINWGLNEKRYYLVDAHQPYRYYRLLVDGGNSRDIIRLYDWKLYAETP